MPLFNFTHSVHPQARSLLFDQSLKQGTVGKRLFPFKPTPKFFIILNKDPQENGLLLFLSQSDPQYALRHPILKTHLIKTNPEDSDNIFYKDCYIDCTQVHRLDRSQLLSEFINDTSILIGFLPAALLAEVIRTVMHSNLIEQEFQERIC
jgi:hypothetical protein